MMITKYRLGTPINTEAVVVDMENLPFESLPLANCVSEGKAKISFDMTEDAIVFGLGEAIRGINKRNWIYESWCADDPSHTEDKRSLYGAHNFIIYNGKEKFGLFVDNPGKIVWDIGYSFKDKTEITVESTDVDVYYITGETELDIVKQFREIIGKSYVPPFWAFGYQQSCWGYATMKDFRDVRDGYRNSNIPLDCIYMDIDYMDSFKDFTINEENFPDFPAFVQEMKDHNIHLIPIIDAGVKKEAGYDIYEEGHEKGYFCKKADGTDFECGVWPGVVGMPDFLNKDAQKWFGSKYKFLTDMGIDGFWNDMNEPALFYSTDGLKKAQEKLADLGKKEIDIWGFFGMKDAVLGISNSMEDYSSFYHNIDGKMVCHKDVHNIFGTFMTNAAGDFFEEEFGKEKILMFSRASYIGMHRKSGIWFGDNASWWSHILLNLKMLPSVNMCGFLYVGSDLGGFNGNCTRDMLLRWLQLSVFTPLMRNHRALGTRAQEAFQFEQTEDFANVISVRYRLIPYLYKTFKTCAENNDMMFRPLAFDYPEDKIAKETEDQLMLGEECMIAPIYEQNKTGRMVYLPEDMTFVKISGEKVVKESLTKGIHYVEVALNEVPLFIKKGKQIPLCKSAMSTAELNTEEIELI